MDNTFFDYQEVNEFCNTVINLSIGWTNQWAYEDNKNKLLNLKKFAFNFKNEFRRINYNVEEIYDQLDHFESAVSTQETTTGTRDEAIIITALHYANSNSPIIKRKGLFDELKYDIKYKFDALNNLLSFYIQHKENPACIKKLDNLIEKALSLVEELRSKLPEEKYQIDYVVEQYIKFLIKNKNFTRAQYIVDHYAFSHENAAIAKLKQNVRLNNG